MSFDLTSKFNGSTDNNQFPDALTIVVVEELQVNVCPLRVTLSQPLAYNGEGGGISVPMEFYLAWIILFTFMVLLHLPYKGGEGDT